MRCWPSSSSLTYRGKFAVASRDRLFRLGLPGEEAADRMFAVQRIHQPAYLVTVPDVASLELR